MTLSDAVVAVALFAAGATAHGAPGPVTLRPYAAGFSSPVDIAHANDGSGRLFVVEQAGRIRIIKNGVVLPTPFLDITSQVQSGGEQGLLGVAFDPSYASNREFYVFYTRPPADPAGGGNEIAVARYGRNAGETNPDVVTVPGTVILTIAHPAHTNHNGGRIAFGPDGFLHVGVGDGGGGGDPFNAGQNLGDLRGKILRLDVRGSSTYTSPATNPFVGQPGARPRYSPTACAIPGASASTR